MRHALRLARVALRAPVTKYRPVYHIRSISCSPPVAAPKRPRKKKDNVIELTLDLGDPEPKTSQAELEASNAQAKTIEDQVRQAILEHRIPNTELGCSVYRNVLRFPDCIVLTRVGKFYELAGLVDIKLAMKMHRVVPRAEADMILEGDSAVRKPKTSDPQRLFPFAGFPVYQIEKYLKILVQDLGHTVVLVEETDDELASQNIKLRKVGRVVTPGTLVDASWLNGDESRYLLAISVSDQPVKADTEDGEMTLGLWLAYTDVSTGEFFSKETTLAQLEDELARISPREVVLDKSLKSLWSAEGDQSAADTIPSSQELMSLLRLCGAHVSFADTFRTPYLEGREAVEFRPENLVSLEARSISLLRHHLQFALRELSPDLSNPDRQVESAYMHIDAATLNALEIRHSFRSGDATRANPISAKGTLLSVLNRTVTPSGHRLLMRTLSSPLTSVEKISHRQDLVQAFVDREDLRDEVRSILRPLKDMMRLVQRFKTHRGNADDIWETSVWIRGIQRICRRIQMEIDHELKRVTQLGIEADPGVARLQIFLDSLRPLDHLADEIERTVNGQLIRASRRPTAQSLSIDDDDDLDSGQITLPEEEDVMPEPLEEIEFPEGMTMTNRGTLQTYRNYEIAEKQQYWINAEEYPKLKALKRKLDKIDRRKAAIQDELRAKFEVAEKDLVLLGNNERIGYHLHLSKPADRTRALNDERFKAIPMTTKNLEDTVWTDLGKQRDQIVSDLLVEQAKVARALRQQMIDTSDDFQHDCGLVDELDMAMGFAQTAVEMHYTRPRVTTGTEFKVVNGRHPAVEAALHSTARLFVPNTTDMTPDSHLHIITGPNQGGKSTFLRQTAVIAILAQSGSFVPADEAEIGVVDKVFSRIGARDDLFRDRSTFMLEMVETAAILRYATRKSLVIMDEIGRGTTLQAGMAIAYATLDYILQRIKCRTLFATHYHELEGMLLRPVQGDESRETEGYRDGIEFWCTDVDEADGALSYSYRLKKGINRNSHAILAARLAGMPQGFLKVANEKLELLTLEKEEAERRKAEEKEA